MLIQKHSKNPEEFENILRILPEKTLFSSYFVAKGIAQRPQRYTLVYHCTEIQ